MDALPFADDAAASVTHRSQIWIDVGSQDPKEPAQLHPRNRALGAQVLLLGLDVLDDIGSWIPAKIGTETTANAQPDR